MRRFNTAWKHIAIGIYRHFGPCEAVVEKVEPTGPRIAKIIGKRSARKPILPCAAARPEFANPRVFVGAKHIVQRPLFNAALMAIGEWVCLAYATVFEHGSNFFGEGDFLVALHSNMKVIHA